MDVEDEVCGGTSPRVASEASDRDAEGGTMQLDVEGEDEEARCSDGHVAGKSGEGSSYEE